MCSVLRKWFYLLSSDLAYQCMLLQIIYLSIELTNKHDNVRNQTWHANDSFMLFFLRRQNAKFEFVELVGGLTLWTFFIMTTNLNILLCASQ